MNLIKLSFVLITTALTLIMAKHYIHMLQLEGYFLSQYLPHLFARIKKPSLFFKKQQVKKPLVYTQRIKRLFFVYF